MIRRILLTTAHPASLALAGHLVLPDKAVLSNADTHAYTALVCTCLCARVDDRMVALYTDGIAHVAILLGVELCGLIVTPSRSDRRLADRERLARASVRSLHGLGLLHLVEEADDWSE